MFLWLALLLLAILVVVNISYFYQQVRFMFFSGKTHTLVFRENSGESVQKNSQPNRLVIKSLQLDLPVIFPSGSTEAEYQTALQSGVVHYPNTALAGQPGNVYIFGHSSDYIWSKGKYKSAFALLPKLEVGNQIILTDASGTPYTYQVTQTFIAPPTATYLLNQDLTQNTLTLQTSYPLGTALKRYIIQAKLIQN